MDRRYHRNCRDFEDPAKVDPYCIVPKNVSVGALRELLQRVFPNDTAKINHYASRMPFNGLLDWVGGDLRWPIATIVLHFGLGRDHQFHGVRNIVRILDINPAAVQRVTIEGGGELAFNRLLKAADQRIEHAPSKVRLHNELRAAGLRSTVWMALARASIFTMTDLRRRHEGRGFRSVRGIGPRLIAEIEQVLNPK